MNVDYEVSAQYKGHKSDTKTVSQFDNRQQAKHDFANRYRLTPPADRTDSA